MNNSIQINPSINCFWKCMKREKPSQSIVVTLVETMPEKRLEILAAFEEIRHLDIHEFTITFNLRKLGFDIACINLNESLHQQVSEFLRKWELKFKRKKYLADWCIFVQPEYHSNGVLHYHGIAYFDNANDYWVSLLKRQLNGKFGRSLGKKIHDLTNYVKYISKDYNPHNTHNPLCVHNRGWGSERETKNTTLTKV